MGTWADWPPPGQLLDACKFHAGDAWAASVLRRIASRTPGKPLLPAIADEVVGIVAAAICCDSCCVYVLEGEELVLRAWKNLPPEALAGVKLRLPREGIDWVSAEREPAVVPRRAGADARFKLFNQMPEDYFCIVCFCAPCQPRVSGGCDQCAESRALSLQPARDPALDGRISSWRRGRDG